jgi:ferredoxin-NADP reductase
MTSGVSPPTNGSAEVYSVRLLKRRRLDEGTFEFTLSRPDGFSFRAGQCIRFEQPAAERDYSLVNGPAAAELQVCVRIVQDGHFTPRLPSAAIHSRFDISGPHGYFIFQPSERPAVFVASGTGIAPFVAMARSGVRGFTLLHGAREAAGLYYQAELRAAAAGYVACLSGAAASAAAPADAFTGRVTAYLGAHLAPGAYDFYLCGRSEMIRDVTLLVDRRFAASRVRSEIFF